MKNDDVLLDKRVIELNRIIVELEARNMWFLVKKMRGLLVNILSKEEKKVA